MKRMVGIVCVLLAMAMLLTACGQFTCADCKQEVKGKPHGLDVAGEIFLLCDDCYEEYREKKIEMNKPVKNGVGDLTQIVR